MDEKTAGGTPAFQGTEHEVAHKLRELHRRRADPVAVGLALQQVQEGYRHILCAGEEFEVLDREWSIVQDVYGCEDGRGCRAVSQRQRRCFEAMIRARVQTEE